MAQPEHSATVLWLIRHPEPEASAVGRCYGSLDIPLSPEGLRHAHALAAALAGEPFAAIYTSPLQRCAETARILAAGRACPVETVNALREIDFGTFEGRSYDEIAALDPAAYREWMEYPTQAHFPEGESFQHMRSRVLSAASDLLARHCGGCFALITHGGAIRVILAEALGMPPGNLFRIAQRYGALNRIHYMEGIPVVELVNASIRTQSTVPV
ncbi:MAG TPA: alpha-ribazole phosphatase [Bryobacteraceae bacterium]|nr:alpha-ribazole phosphatase [Bryobacteraceae bacterium]